ncbi:hypothetical protein FB451DRAFT_1370880 [Mycena latifolia]|nr:hypothetical protein FB451DRAFT_1370880 [Mycena latifolia]
MPTDLDKYRAALASDGAGMFTFAQLLGMMRGWPKLEKLILKRPPPRGARARRADTAARGAVRELKDGQDHPSRQPRRGKALQLPHVRRAGARCGSAIWLPRRHRPLRAFSESGNLDHLTASSFIPRAVPVSTTESNRTPHISISDIPDFLEHYIRTFTVLPTLQHRASNHGNKYWPSIDIHFLLPPTLSSTLTPDSSSRALGILRHSYAHFPARPGTSSVHPRTHPYFYTAVSVLWVQPARTLPADILDALRLEALCLLADSELHLETVLPSLTSLKHLDTHVPVLAPRALAALTYRVFPAQLLDLAEALAAPGALPALKALEVKGALPPGPGTQAPMQFTPTAALSMRTAAQDSAHDNLARYIRFVQLYPSARLTRKAEETAKHTVLNSICTIPEPVVFPPHTGTRS